MTGAALLLFSCTACESNGSKSIAVLVDNSSEASVEIQEAAAMVERSGSAAAETGLENASDQSGTGQRSRKKVQEQLILIRFIHLLGEEFC